MLRYRFGAYEPLDDALAALASTSLVVHRRSGRVGHTRQHDYFLTTTGRSVAREILEDVPVLPYYVDRVALVLRVAGGLSGTTLKDMQYEQPEYADTAWRSRIASIADRVRQRLANLEPGSHL